jgi:hypothetical protein
MDYQVSGTKFHTTFRTHYIPVDMMGKKRQEFMDLKQGRRYVYDYSKLFNHLVQYALDQVYTDEKKDRFMIDLSTKLQEHVALNTGGTFPKFVSIVIIVDNAIRAHKETKKRNCGSSVQKCSPEVPDGVPPCQPQPHQHQHQ